MPPKIKITKEEVINTAMEIVRKNGADALNARAIAMTLNCSTQPIFSNFATMDELWTAVLQNSEKMYEEYIDLEIKSGKYPDYKASGMAYIRFAKEETEVFKLLFMRDRSKEKVIPEMELNGKMENIVHNNTGLEGDEMKLFHLEMWAYVHGIATMFATGYLNLEWGIVSKMLTDAYQGLRKQYIAEN